MRIIDLSHPISADMPLWPGTPSPEFSALNTVVSNGFGERWMQLSSHTGTHIDAPAHIVDGAASLDQLDISSFIGKGVVLDLRESRSETISRDTLLASRERIEEAEFLLLHSGWSRFWGSDTYKHDYPVLSIEAADWLAGLGMKGIGIDAPSFDAEDSDTLPVHRKLLGAGLVLIENLTSLELLVNTLFVLSALPLNIVDAEACPARAVAFLPPFL
jgi:arylformamidase